MSSQKPVSTCYLSIGHLCYTLSVTLALSSCCGAASRVSKYLVVGDSVLKCPLHLYMLHNCKIHPAHEPAGQTVHSDAVTPLNQQQHTF